MVTEISTREELEEYRLKLKEFLKDKKAVKTTKRSLHNVVWGQCSQMLRTKLKGDDELAKIEIDGDVVELLKKIRGVCRQMTTNESLYDSIDEAKRRYYTYRQQPEDDNETHLRTFKSNSDVIEHYKGSLYEDKALIDYEKEQDAKNGKNHNESELKFFVKDRMMGTALLKRSGMSRYGPLMTNIRDQFGYGIDVYPKTLASGHDMLEDYARSRRLYSKKKKLNISDERTNREKEKRANEDATGAMYAQEEVVPGTNGKDHASIQCHSCQKFGHYLSHCPEENGQQNMNVEEEESEEDTKDEGAQNMQIEEIIRGKDSSSSDESYLVDFANF